MMKLGEIANVLEGQLIGDADQEIIGLCPLEDPVSQQICFYTGTSEKALLKYLNSKLPAAVIISKQLIPSSELQEKLALLQVENPFQAMIKLMPRFYPVIEQERSINSKAEIHHTATIGKNVSIGAFAVIGENVEIADDVVIYPHVVLYPGVKIGKNSVLHSGSTVRENCVIGENCILQNGVVLGAEGFGYVPDKNGVLQPVPQPGITTLSDYVDVGANACIDRATLGATRIGKGTKIDNLAQIGHNVQIGQHSAICGLTGISGSCKIGNHVVLGGKSGVADHLTVGDGVRVGSAGIIENNILEKGDYAGHPLMKAGNWKRYVTKRDQLVKLLKLLPKE